MSRPLLELDHEHQELDEARDNASLQLDRAILKLAGVLGRLRAVRPKDRAEQRDGRRVRYRPQVPRPIVATFRVRAELRFSPELRLSAAPASSTPEHRRSNSMPRSSPPAPARVDRIDQVPAPRPRARSASPRERQGPRPSSPQPSWTAVFDQLG